MPSGRGSCPGGGFPFRHAANNNQKNATMTRSDLVELLAERFPRLTQKDADAAARALLQAMSDALEQGQRIEIRGFGSFGVTRRNPRLGRNPRTGQSVAIPERRVPHFKPGKALRDAVDASRS
ncbi:integration host factor subunit beta [Ottowia sp. oral taxon 894]|uniref:integration host factor subunit beta n=1 Tax=Ottowia sp. oral taxon 894 TaxID=1658672 RepID=UPI00211020D0|nr:integration host factor subunit beta [Ottowia sp. oral taxon 894]